MFRIIFLLSIIANTILLASKAFAETAASAAGGAANAPSPLASLVPFALIFLVFYFLMIRPQKKRAQQEETMLATLGKGDEIFTKSGIIGIISGMNDKVVTLEISDGVKIKVLRAHIGGLAKKLLETEKENTSNPSKK